MGKTSEGSRVLRLESLREDYRRSALDESNAKTNPFEQFHDWFLDAQATELKEPNAMSLATATLDGKPSNRIVLLKEADRNGFVFYTSYTSRKGQELASNPLCAATFLWAELERQVRIEGEVQKVSPEKSELYFRQRPRGSRLGAVVSSQSAVIDGRQILLDGLAELEKRYGETEEIPRPSDWGGYCIVPYSIEFWQGRPNRLHDRLVYKKVGETWRIERLSP